MASSKAIGAIPTQIVSMLEDIQRKLHAVPKNDELDYLIFQIERIETILCLCMQTMEANSTVLSKIFEAKYLLLSWRSDRVKNQDDHRFENSLAHAQLHTCTHAHAQLHTCTCTVTHLHTCTDIVREAEVQKYMFTYHSKGQFHFMFILYL